MKLSNADIDMILRLKSGKFVDKSLDPTLAEWNFEVDNPSFKLPFNLCDREPKNRFVPSKWERLRISKYIQAMKKGHMKTPAQARADREAKAAEADKMWDIWEDDTIVSWKPRRMPKAIVAPKRDLPGHSESCNPPEEYLFNQEEKDKWEK